MIRGASRLAFLSIAIVLLAGCAGSEATEFEGSYLPAEGIEESGTNGLVAGAEPTASGTPVSESLRIDPADGDAEFPPTNGCIIVRTDFSDDTAWAQVVGESQTLLDGQLLVEYTFVNDLDFEGMTADELSAVHEPANDLALSIFAIADAETSSDPDRSVRVVDIFRDRDDLRSVPEELSSVVVNLDLANMDWEDFVEGSRDGVFRGF